ncbi:MAG: porin [Gammaproteobacteria bacterium]|nr:porin [Gammaproteobacteria bacterium]
MNNQRTSLLGAIVLAALAAPSARAIDVTAGQWTLSFDGNVNANYIYSNCQDHNDVAGGLACVSDTTSDNSSSVSNGLLPAALSVSGATTQDGQNLGFTFGLYPGISTNDGGSPNLQDIAAKDLGHTALGTAGLDIRQVFLTVGGSWGSIMAGRNIGLFGADAILNDMTLLGVGAGNGDYAAPANTSLGSIGLGYIYTDWLSQINYTTPDMGGAKITLGIFDPLNTLGQTPANHSTPGFQGKIAYTAGPLYLSFSGLYQQQRVQCADLGAGACAAGSPAGSYVSYGSSAFDLGGKYDIGGLEFMGWYYRGKGVGTTGLFVLSNDAVGTSRDSDGFLAQVTYKMGTSKVGVNYGVSNLDGTALDRSTLCVASGVVGCLVRRNEKWSLGLYQNVTANLLFVTEFSRLQSKSDADQSNTSWNFNAGLFLKF